MKVPTNCLFCKNALTHERAFPNIAHDDSYYMRCIKCPINICKWGSVDRSGTGEQVTSNSYATTVHWASKDSKRKNSAPNVRWPNYLEDEKYPFTLCFDLDDLSIEFDLRNFAGPNGHHVNIFRVEYTPAYKSEHIYYSTILPDIDFTTITEAEFRQKIKIWLTFM